jgi:putative NADH-flavin reductase
MKIVIFGATGNVGRRIIIEALNRGHGVVAVVRDPAKVGNPEPRVALVQGDATNSDDVIRVARGADAIVCAISPRPNARGVAAPSLVSAARALIAGAQQAGIKRLMIVGGAGSLEAAPGKAIMNLPDLSPAAEIHPGERTGKYRTAGDSLFTDSTGKSEITFEDDVVALIDELEHPRHVRRRFSVAY